MNHFIGLPREALFIRLSITGAETDSLSFRFNQAVYYLLVVMPKRTVSWQTSLLCP